MPDPSRIRAGAARRTKARREGSAAVLVAVSMMSALALSVVAPSALAQPISQANRHGLRGYMPERFDEDWSIWSLPTQRAKRRLPWDEVKAVPVGRQGWLTIGGDYRVKVESIDRPAFGLTGAQPDAWIMNRLLLHGDLHVNDRIRAFLQLGYHQVDGRDASFPFDNNDFDIAQGFVDVRHPVGEGEISLRLGRQEIQAGSRKFWGTRQPVNIRAAFDGARLAWRSGHWRADMTLIQPVRILPGAFDDEADDTVAITTGRVGRDFGPYRLKADLLYTHIDRDRSVIQGIALPDDRHTFGVRLEGRNGPWAGELEWLLQRGESGTADIRAQGGWAEVRFDPGSGGWKPVLGMRALWGSGDADPNDGIAGTFDPTFPFPANDSLMISHANQLILSPVITMTPTSTSRIELRLDSAIRLEAADAIYSIPAFPIADTAGLPGDNLLTVTPTANASWQVTPEWSLAGQLAYMMTEGALDAAGGDDSLYVSAWTSYRF